ncbi:uncharacterized protein LOC135937760 isoform X2 [Cloeon dipterum]|uniref:uncharacterized protein LOC135937760 isoform X2 n=1 Tax=Cloeon dipterum TaxID=197152 RepID=UPI00321FCDF8
MEFQQEIREISMPRSGHRKSNRETVAMRNLLVAFALVGLLAKESLGGDLSLERHRRDADQCSLTTIKKSLDCCDLPDGIPEEFYGPCLSKVTKKKRDPKAKRIQGMSFACTLSCILEKTDMLKSDGYANLTGLQQLYLSNSSAAWVPVVNAAFNKCTKEQKTAEITTEGECKLPNLHFAFCLYQYAVQKCPSESLKRQTGQSAKIQAAKCKSSIAKVSKCDPWTPLQAPSDSQQKTTG